MNSPRTEAASGELFIARLRRQQAEQDRQILANRVHLLEIEAKKAKKMINETKRRTQQLRAQKQSRADDRFQKSDKEAMEHEHTAKRQAQKRSSIEAKLKTEKDAAKRILMKRRAAKAAQIDAARDERKARIVEYKAQQQKEAARVRRFAAAAKKNKEAQQKKRREREAAARARSRADYEARVKRQNDESTRLQSEVKSMRERELDSIKLLQKMQKLQEDAIIALAAVAGNEPEPTPRARDDARRARDQFEQQ